MPAVHDVVIDERISQGSVGGAQFNTTLMEALGGWEQRIANWSEGRLQWDISRPLTDRDRLHYVLAFFRARRGRAYGFLFKDWADYWVGMDYVNDVLSYTSYQQFGTGDGATDDFQLYKTYFDDPPQVFLDQTLQGTSTFDYEVFAGTATVEFDTAPASGKLVLFNGVESNETANGSIDTFTFTSVPSEQRKITRPRRGTVKIYVDGTEKTEGTHYTIDYTTGVVTFTGGNIPTTNAKVQWAGQFYVPVRFDTDVQKALIESFGKGSWNNVMVVELRE